MPVRKSAPVGAPIWIDLASSDVERSQAFYGTVFGWTTYLHTADMKATLDSAMAADAVSCAGPPEPMQVGDRGWMGMLSDPGGAFFGLWQPAGHRGFEVVN